MANDGGLRAKLEQWMADTLAALQSGGSDVFKTPDVWRHQVGPTKSGMEAFARYQPFAFAGWDGGGAAREGGKDLRQIIRLSVVIGVESRKDGDARTGNSRKLGTSKICELVIAAFDKVHPGGGLTCDEFYYMDEVEQLDAPKKHATQLFFETSYMT